MAVSRRWAMQQYCHYKAIPATATAKRCRASCSSSSSATAPTTWYFANNNARHFSFNADERSVPVYQFASEAQITRSIVLPRVRRSVPWGNDQPLHGVGGQRAEALDDAALPNLCRQSYRRSHRSELRKRLHLAHHGFRQDADLLQASTLLKDNPDIRASVCGGSARPGPPDPRGIQPFSGRLRRREHQHQTLVRRRLSDDYADKAIVTTIQKLGRSARAQAQRQGTAEAITQPAHGVYLRRRHASQFGDNHKAIKEFLIAQLFGFTGTPNLRENASYQQIEGQQASYRAT